MGRSNGKTTSYMKQIWVFILLALSIPAMAQWPWGKVEGNGQLKKETRQVSNYTSIASSGSWDVMIAYGESNSIQVEGDANLLTYIETKVEDGKLSIKTTKNVSLHSSNKITIYVSATRLTGVSLSGSGDIIGKGNFFNEGNGNFKLSGSGTINLAFNKYKSVDISISGSGNIHLSGTSDEVSARISGSGNADCSGVIANQVSASISGSGNVNVFANTSLEANISGSGNVYYQGAATDIRSHKAGRGKVTRS